MDNWQEFINKIGNNRFKSTDLAKLSLEVERIEELIKITKEARNYKIPVYIIGTGSSLPTSQIQINGLLIKNNCHRFDVFGIKGKMNKDRLGIERVSVFAESGTNINQLVRFTIEEGLSGLEYHLGMPGTIGGAIFTNARYTPKNIYLNDAIEKIRILNKEGEILEVGGDHFSSRDGREFTQADTIILSAIFRMHPEDKKLLWERGSQAAAYRNELLKPKI